MKKYSFAFSLVALFVFAGTQSGYCVILNGVNVSQDKLICYLFIGHSNMQGYGGIPDTVTDPRVWAYSETLGFWNARDPVETTYQSPAEILYSSNWNTWYPIRSSPLKMLFPSGGEVFAFTDSIPITWMCDPESLSVILISISQDSGKTWSYINSDPLKSEAFPWIKTFYWTPSKSGLTFTTGANLMIEINDYDGKHFCRSNTFSLDSMPINGVRVSKIPSYTGGFRINITRTNIFVSLPTPPNVPITIELSNIAGRKIYSATHQACNGNLNIPVSGLSTGTYLMSITGGNIAKSSSFVVTK